MGREFHVSPSINGAYYVVEDQRFLRSRRSERGKQILAFVVGRINARN